MPEAKDTRRRILEAGRQVMVHKGYAAVGLTEVLLKARVPKGSFYNFFESKDAFGEAMMQAYFTEYLADMDRTFADETASAADRLFAYLQQWSDGETMNDGQGKCLAVKLGAEVADLSDRMRAAFVDGTNGIIDRLEQIIRRGIEDKSLEVTGDPGAAAEVLYDTWLGASILAKIHRKPAPLDRAMAGTRALLRS